MSYILDALQKSEQERQQQSTPTLTSQYETHNRLPTRRTNLWWLLVGVLLAALVTLVIWRPFDRSTSPSPAPVKTQQPAVTTPVPPTEPAPSRPGPTTQSAPTATHAAPEAEVVSAAVPVVPDEVPAQTQAPATLTPDIQALYQSTAPPSNEPLPAASTITEPEVAPAVDAPPANLATPEAIFSGDFVGIDQLPDTVKSEIPPFVYIAHVHSGENQQGFVVINDLKLSPGQRVDAELYVEKIAADHIIMSYRGYFFTMAAMQNWSGFGQ